MLRAYVGKDDDPFDPDGIWGEFANTVKPAKKTKTVAKPIAKPRAKVLKEPAEPALPRTPTSTSPTSLPTLQRRKGKLPQIGAQIDLHGFTQKLAYERLTSFIHRCMGQSVKYALVVTGKGNPLTGTGVIQKELPRWCATPALAPYIVSCSFAPPQLGGNGAYIIHLRTKKRGPSS